MQDGYDWDWRDGCNHPWFLTWWKNVMVLISWIKALSCQEAKIDWDWNRTQLSSLSTLELVPVGRRHGRYRYSLCLSLERERQEQWMWMNSFDEKAFRLSPCAVGCMASKNWMLMLAKRERLALGSFSRATKRSSDLACSYCWWTRCTYYECTYIAYVLRRQSGNTINRYAILPE